MYITGDYEDDSDDDSDSGRDFTMVTQGETLCIPALGYLKKCNGILQTMWKMPACPVFNGAHRYYQFLYVYHIFVCIICIYVLYAVHF